MNLKVLISVVAAAVVIAGAALVASLAGFFSPAEDDALDLIPADSVIYVNIFLDPSPAQKLALDDLLAHFPEASDRDAARDALVELLDEGLAEVGLTFEDDIEPWLGDQVSFFMQVPANTTADPAVGVLLETEDTSAARRAVDKAQDNTDGSFSERSYRGIDYEVTDNGDAVGIIESFLVSANEEGLKAVIDTIEGDALSSSDRFERATAGLEEDRLALGYFDFAPFARLAGGFGGFTGGPFDPATQGPAAFVLYARGNAVVAEGSSEVPREGLGAELTEAVARESKLLERLPDDAWVAVGAPQLGATLRHLVDSLEEAFAQAPGMFPGLGPGGLIEGFEAQLGIDLERDLFSWMGDAAFFASGATLQTVQGGAVLEATDPRAARQALTRIKSAIERAGGPVRGLGKWRSYDGFALRESGMPEPINFVAAADRVLVIYGDAATGRALGSDPSLAGNDTFEAARAALGDDFALNAFVDLQAIVSLADAAGLDDSEFGDEIDPWVEPLSFVSVGGRLEGETIVQRLVIGVR